MNRVDLSGQKVISVRDVEAAAKAGASLLVIREGALLTPSARDAILRCSLTVQTQGQCGAAPAAAPARRSAAKVVKPEIERLFNSPEAQTIKDEICDAGRKLWQRGYVDGNGGNISYRIGENAVLCTPTLVSKADLKPEDICLVDLAGNQLAGERPRTSEVLLHLEIYKHVPGAKGVVHCHPPHATAYAITGRVPPPSVIPEFDVLIGSAAFAPYETPGTQEFAETVIPFARSHNTILLGNHGVVCWADTVTHAEWYVEVLETYCWTLLISQQLGVPYSRIPSSKTPDLLEMKKRLGLPDARFDMKECVQSDTSDQGGVIALTPPVSCGCPQPPAETGAVAADDVESLVKLVTDAVLAAIRRG